jgi:hypothetical protein
MAGGSELPKNEAELLQTVPPSNQSGVFPRALLNTGERLYYEARPSLWGRYWGRIVLLILGVLFFLIGVGSPGYVENPAFLFFEGLFFLLILLTVILWSRTVYALSAQRVLKVSGLRQGVLEEADYDQVTNLSLIPSSGGTLSFDLVPMVAATPQPSARGRTAKLLWTAARQAPQVYAFVQRAFALNVLQVQADRARALLLRQATANKIQCSYCRALVDLSVVEGTAVPKCPQCGAPLLAGAVSE